MNNLGQVNPSIGRATESVHDNPSSPKSEGSSRGNLQVVVSRTASGLLEAVQFGCILSPKTSPTHLTQTATAIPPPDTDKFSPENIHAMLEINMAIEPPLDSRTFNSFMPALALAASTVPVEERLAMLAGTLKLFGVTPGSERRRKLANAVNAFSKKKPDGSAWSWLDFADPTKDPLDELDVYEYPSSI